MRRCIAALAATVVSLGLLVASADAAGAHRNDESYLYLDIGDDDLRGTVQLPYPDMRTVLGLKLTGSEADVRSEIEAELDLIRSYASERTSVGADGTTFEMVFDGYRLLEEEEVSGEGLGYVILPFVVTLPDGTVPQRIDVRFTPFLDEIPDRNNLVLIANDWKRGVIDNEASEIVVLNAGRPADVIDLGDASQWKNFDASVDLGIDHIRTGPDHIFFIFVLLLPSVLVLRRGRWAPAPRFRTSLLRVLIVASMFTLAHSVTFTLAGLDLVPLPPARITESIIALSIAVAAVNNLWPIIGHREWAIAFGFGLFHGLGFAGFVDDLEIDRATQLVSLLGRNVGIEIGQAVIVLITFPALFLLSRTKFYRVVYPAATLALAAVSSVWVVERVFDLDVGINGKIDKLVEWPRALWVCVAATIVAALLARWSARRGHQWTVAEVTEDDDATAVAAVSSS